MKLLVGRTISAAQVRRVPARIACPVQWVISNSRSLSSSSSSSSSPPTPTSTPTLQDGLPGWIAYIKRCQSRSSELAQYREQDLFAPFPLALSDRLLFAKLQQPTHTRIDLKEFLNGASSAYEFVVRTMFSRDLRRFALGDGEKTEAIALLEQAVWPNCYHPHLHNIRSMENDLINKMELKDVTIKSVQLIDVQWQRVPLSAVLAEEQFARDATNQYIQHKFHADAATFKAGAAFDAEKAELLDDRVFAGNSSTADTSTGSSRLEQDETMMVEQLRLDVYIESIEHLVGSADDDEDEQDDEDDGNDAENGAGLELIVREIDSVVQFGSLVTTEQDLDWRIVRFKESTSEVVSRERLE